MINAMKCRIALWSTPRLQPVPEATEVPGTNGEHTEKWELEIDDLFAFAEKHQVNVMVRRPNDAPSIADGNWWVWISKLGFKQC